MRTTRAKAPAREEYWVLPDFGWGYADNWSAEAMDPDHGNLFRIADAVDDAGNPADLEYIDFVKVQTAQMAVHRPHRRSLHRGLRHRRLYPSPTQMTAMFRVPAYGAHSAPRCCC